MSDPFFIEGPAILSISGGRTSGYMLWRILQAHGGKLPEDVRAVFANTGKEMAETLDFLFECSVRWGVQITWLEWHDDDVPQRRFREVTYKTASRNGEPYAANIERKNLLPNPVARFCTQELKIRPMKLYCQQILGWDEWYNVVGIRADEPRRVARLNPEARDVFERIAPLARAGVTAEEVGRFWEAQPFDLHLPNMSGRTMHGNCDLCFLKGAKQVYSLIREQPKRAIWWMEQEAKVQSSGQFKGDGARFRADRPSYKQMYDAALAQDELFATVEDEPLQDCMCVD